MHGIWFNRGVAGSQAFVKRFGAVHAPGGCRRGPPGVRLAVTRAGRGVRALRRPRPPTQHWGLRGAFYELTWQSRTPGLAAAAAAGADVALVVHGRDRDPAGGRRRRSDRGRQPRRGHRRRPRRRGHLADRAQQGRAAAQQVPGADPRRSPVAVWTGSTNLTQGAVFGHLNVGHSVTDAALAQQFLDYWTAAGRPDPHHRRPADLDRVAQPVRPRGAAPGRADDGLLAAGHQEHPAGVVRGGRRRRASSSAHLTGAFGLHQVFRDELGVDRAIVRTVLLDRAPSADCAHPHHRPRRAHLLGRLPPPRRRSTGGRQEHLTGFNTWVKFIHTKIILVDPLTDEPTIITGSANYSDSSTTDNEENTVIIRGERDGCRAASRVADIYLTEYHRLFMHFVFRDRANDLLADPGRRPAERGRLVVARPTTKPGAGGRGNARPSQARPSRRRGPRTLVTSASAAR